MLLYTLGVTTCKITGKNSIITTAYNCWHCFTKFNSVIRYLGLVSNYGPNTPSQSKSTVNPILKMYCLNSLDPQPTYPYTTLILHLGPCASKILPPSSLYMLYFFFQFSLATKCSFLGHWVEGELFINHHRNQCLTIARAHIHI